MTEYEILLHRTHKDNGETWDGLHEGPISYAEAVRELARLKRLYASDKDIERTIRFSRTCWGFSTKYANHIYEIVRI